MRDFNHTISLQIAINTVARFIHHIYYVNYFYMKILYEH